jgi:hypothetical protein
MITLEEIWYKVYGLMFFPSIMNFWDARMLVLILKIYIYHNPGKC